MEGLEGVGIVIGVGVWDVGSIGYAAFGDVLFDIVPSAHTINFNCGSFEVKEAALFRWLLIE